MTTIEIIRIAKNRNSTEKQRNPMATYRTAMRGKK